MPTPATVPITAACPALLGEPFPAPGDLLLFKTSPKQKHTFGLQKHALGLRGTYFPGIFQLLAQYFVFLPTWRAPWKVRQLKYNTEITYCFGPTERAAGVYHRESRSGKYRLTYAEAKAVCEYEGGHLATYQQLEAARKIGQQKATAVCFSPRSFITRIFVNVMNSGTGRFVNSLGFCPSRR